tara:strand:- start:4353 stop:5513 length:1161 start_codon:yes stop_codon:yes gene_type:complete
MNTKFNLKHNPVEIITGLGSRNKLKEKIESDKYFILASKRGKEVIKRDRILNKIIKSNKIISCINNYPDIELIEDIFNQIKDERVDFIIGFGGGSVLDATKILSYCLSFRENKIPVRELLMSNLNLENKNPIKTICIPTTFGTGSEVTPFSTYWDFTNKKKYSLQSSSIYPILSIIDHELGVGMPKDVMISTGLDAINQAAESLWNINANIETMELSIESFSKGIYALNSLLDDQYNLKYWRQMSECSLMSGLAISETKTALCHSISYPLTTHFKIPHGIACTFTMPSVLEFCLKNDDGRLKELAKRLNINDNYEIHLKNYFLDINSKFSINKIVKNFIKKESQLLDLIDEMYDPSRAKNCMRNPNPHDIEIILKKSYKSYDYEKD